VATREGLLSEIVASKRMLVVRNRSGNRIAGSIVRCFGGAEFVDLLRPPAGFQAPRCLGSKEEKEVQICPELHRRPYHTALTL
jgi:hypothetical protein